MTDQATENAKKQLAEGKEARAKQDEQRAAVMKGKPTPTQEENDIAVLGGHPDLEDDGSGPDPNNAFVGMRHTEAKPSSGGYQTRQSSASTQHRNKSE